MIVLSILTALGLEQLAVSIHDASQASASRTRIEAELARTATELRQAESANAERTERVRNAYNALVAGIIAGGPTEAQIAAASEQLTNGFGVSVVSPERDAWDAAIADQSASHLASADLQRYAEIYTAERDLTEMAQLLISGEWLTRTSDTILDVQFQRTDPRTLAQTMSRYLLAVQEIGQAEKNLLELITAGRNGPTAATAR